MFAIYAPISALFRISYPQAGIPLLLSLLISSDVMGGDFSDILLLFPIFFIDAFSSSDLGVVSFCVMRPSSSGYGFSILILFTPAHLDLDFKVLSRLALSLLFPLLEVHGIFVLPLCYLWLLYLWLFLPDK